MAQKQNFTFRFDPELIDEIDLIARIKRRSRTNMLEVLMLEYVERFKKEQCSGSSMQEKDTGATL